VSTRSGEACLRTAIYFTYLLTDLVISAVTALKSVQRGVAKVVARNTTLRRSDPINYRLHNYTFATQTDSCWLLADVCTVRLKLHLIDFFTILITRILYEKYIALPASLPSGLNKFATNSQQMQLTELE